MSTANTPKGSPLEHEARSNSFAAKVTVIALAHIAVVAGGLVFYGCSREAPPSGQTPPPSTTKSGTGTTTEPIPPAPYSDPNAIVAPVVTTAPTTTGATPSPVTSVNPNLTTPATSVGGATSPVGGFEPAAGSPAGGTGMASEHKVEKGDTGASIAKKHGVTLEQLKAANPGVNWSKLKIGQAVQVPAPAPAAANPPTTPSGTAPSTPSTPSTSDAGGETVHTVKTGETLMSISKKYGVGWKQIRNLNGLRSESIKVGQKLKIPAKAAAGASSGGSAPAATPAEPSAVPLPPSPGPRQP